MDNTTGAVLQQNAESGCGLLMFVEAECTRGIHKALERVFVGTSFPETDLPAPDVITSCRDNSIGQTNKNT